METWSTHHLFSIAREKLGTNSALKLQSYANHLKAQKLPVIFSLGHLSKITGIRYGILHDSINRKREAVNYSLFTIHKRSGGKRFIHAVNGKLFELHKYINSEILKKVSPHKSAYAFHASGGIRRCAEMHCGAKWLFQFDLKDFFYSINELDIYKIFKGLGYRRLLAFELARLCTTIHIPKTYYRQYLQINYKMNRDKVDYSDGQRRVLSLPYNTRYFEGVLPQGAPTSPMLSNLVARSFDEDMLLFAQGNGFVYTRYADDITLSSSYLPHGQSIGRIQKNVISMIRAYGFTENKNKIRVAGPGSKKLVLGLLVDGNKPRISRETYKRIDRHLYAFGKFGLVETATHEGFDSAYGFYNHLSGLISFIKDVDLDRWKVFKKKFDSILLPFAF